MDPVEEIERANMIVQIKRHFQMVCDVYERGARDPDMWHKAILCIVYRLVGVGAYEEAHLMIPLIKKDWLELPLHHEMERDPGFGKMVVEVCNKFVREGIVKSTLQLDDLQPTQAIAKA